MGTFENISGNVSQTLCDPDSIPCNLPTSSWIKSYNSLSLSSSSPRTQFGWSKDAPNPIEKNFKRSPLQPPSGSLSWDSLDFSPNSSTFPSTTSSSARNLWLNKLPGYVL